MNRAERRRLEKEAKKSAKKAVGTNAAEAIARSQVIYNEALALEQKGKIPQAISRYKAAIKINPNFAEAYNNLGNLFTRQDKWQDAEAAYRQALLVYPENTMLMGNLGDALRHLGKLDEAGELLGKVLMIEPDSVQALNNIGSVQMAQRQPNNAIKNFSRAVKINPRLLESQINLANALEETGEYNDALDALNEALRLNGESPVVYFNIAHVLSKQGKSDEAITMYEKAIALNPDYAGAAFNLAVLQRQKKRYSVAIEICHRLLASNPKKIEVYLELATAHKESGDLEAAIKILKKVLHSSPTQSNVHLNLASLQLEQGLVEDAIASFQQAYRYSTEARFNDLSSYLFSLNYSEYYTPQELFTAHMSYLDALPSTGQFQSANRIPTEVHSKVRVGYVSPDFHRHSVAFFIEPILACHDHDKFEIYCYASVHKSDAVTDRLKRYADHWRDIYDEPDAVVERLIREDSIDILVDLAGHTGGNRLSVFARKPAPVQVTYLGYPNTTGLKSIDYRLTDTWADPAGQDAYYSERLIRLPSGFLCYRPAHDAPEVGPLPALSQGHVTFGSFNNLAKTGPDVIAVWAKILNAIPDSRLLLKNSGLRDVAACVRIHSLFAEHGVSAERIKLIGWLESANEHMALYNQIDIGLDPFPYNGTTTTCEALWMGVPVLTLAGRQHAGRVGVSLLQQAGLSEWVASDKSDYVARAVAFASKLDALSEMRSCIRTRLLNSTLLDEAGFTRILEGTYKELLQNRETAQKSQK